MKRFRTYISSRGSSKDEERPEKNSRHPSALPVRNNNFKFPSTQALAAANAAAHPFEPLYPSLNPHSLRINAKSPGAGDQVPSSHSSSSSPSRTQTKIRKPAPRYSGSSIIVPVPFPSSEPTTASTPTLDTHRLDSRPNRSHGRSKSVRIVVPEDAVFGTVTRSRSLSSPNTNKASRFGVARHSSFAGGIVSNGLHGLSPRQASPLEVVPEHGDDESAPEHHDHEHEIAQSSFSEGHSEDGGKSSDGSDIEDLDENDDNFETATTETQSVESNRESIRLDILDDLATFDDHNPNNSSAQPQDHPVSLVSSQSNIWRPLNIRPRPSATPLVPMSLDEMNLEEFRIHSCIEDDSIVAAPQAVSVEGEDTCIRPNQVLILLLVSKMPKTKVICDIDILIPILLPPNLGHLTLLEPLWMIRSPRTLTTLPFLKG
ncbi:hypothetical protein BT96DRAFT_50967 [Gymnopus androsaceus JB14]|uniref:Uncharacterized protein n=1 Tax=Gymnopus androsaceus JB14 TaxID=1447944 RepID=A0A6A4HM00_9AGAR|nr:hypothetical protein BT96DRAFT_50967 [Gymnopus androsaceus JB14]